MTSKRHHRSVYIPAPLEKALQEHPEINISQVCKVALEVATGLITTPEAQAPGELSSTISGKLSDTEAQLRIHVTALEKISRIAATQAGMVILTQEEAKTYKEILGIGIGAFIFRTKKEAIEEYKREQAKKKIPRKRRNKAEHLQTQPGQTLPATENPKETQSTEPERKCVDCNDPSDIACAMCGAPLCWTCWTGPNLDEPARELCSSCVETTADYADQP